MGHAVRGYKSLFVAHGRVPGPCCSHQSWGCSSAPCLGPGCSCQHKRQRVASLVRAGDAEQSFFGRKRKRLSPASLFWGWQSPPSQARADLTSFQSLPKAAGLPDRSPRGAVSPRLPHNFSPRRPARPVCKSCERRIMFCLPRKASGTLVAALKPQTNKQQLCKGAGQTSPAGNEAQDSLYFNPAKGLLGSEAEPGCAELRMKPYF